MKTREKVYEDFDRINSSFGAMTGKRLAERLAHLAIHILLDIREELSDIKAITNVNARIKLEE